MFLIRPDKFSQAVSGKLDLWLPNSVLVRSPALTPPDLPQIIYMTIIELCGLPPSSSSPAHMARSRLSLDGSLSSEATGNVQS